MPSRSDSSEHGAVCLCCATLKPCSQEHRDMMFRVSTRWYRVVFSSLFLDAVLLVMGPELFQRPCQPHHTLDIVCFLSAIISSTMSCALRDEKVILKIECTLYGNKTFLRYLKMECRVCLLLPYLYLLLWGTSFGVRQTLT